MTVPSSDERIAVAWTEDRRYLHAVASRLLRDPIEAEDIVQDAFMRLASQRVETIEDLRGWLVVVVRRLALDRLRSVTHRLSQPVDAAHLASQSADDGADPADRVTMDDEVRSALGVVLDRLTPAQRTAFLLHDVFGVPYDQVGELVGRSSGACRQLASEARRSIRRGSAEPVASTGTAHDSALSALAGQFAEACARGSIDELARLLDPEASGWATVDGRATGFAKGRTAVAGRLLFFLGPTSTWRLTSILLEDGVGLLATRRSEPVAVIRLEVRNSRVRRLHAVVLRR